MHDQIGVAADGGSEVRVVRERKSEVADVGRLIDGLRHRAHHQRFHEGTLGRLAHPPRDCLQIARRDGLGNVRLDAERSERRGETLELRVLGSAVHAVQRRCYAVFSSSCATATLARIMHSSIRRWASIAHAQLDRAHALARVDDELGFGGVKVQRAAARARLVAARGTPPPAPRAARAAAPSSARAAGRPSNSASLGEACR